MVPGLTVAVLLRGVDEPSASPLVALAALVALVAVPDLLLGFWGVLPPVRLLRVPVPLPCPVLALVRSGIDEV